MLELFCTLTKYNNIIYRFKILPLLMGESWNLCLKTKQIIRNIYLQKCYTASDDFFKKLFYSENIFLTSLCCRRSLGKLEEEEKESTYILSKLGHTNPMHEMESAHDILHSI